MPSTQNTIGSYRLYIHTYIHFIPRPHGAFQWNIYIKKLKKKNEEKIKISK